MLIRRNSKEFKGIQHVIQLYLKKHNRKKLIRLYVVKAGRTLKKMIPVNNLGKLASFYYDLNYEAILEHLRSKDYRLYRSDKNARLYYFKNIHDPISDQTPFELSNSLASKFKYTAQAA